MTRNPWVIGGGIIGVIVLIALGLRYSGLDLRNLSGALPPGDQACAPKSFNKIMLGAPATGKSQPHSDKNAAIREAVLQAYQTAGCELTEESVKEVACTGNCAKKYTSERWNKDAGEAAAYLKKLNEMLGLPPSLQLKPQEIKFRLECQPPVIEPVIRGLTQDLEGKPLVTASVTCSVQCRYIVQCFAPATPAPSAPVVPPPNLAGEVTACMKFKVTRQFPAQAEVVGAAEGSTKEEALRLARAHAKEQLDADETCKIKPENKDWPPLNCGDNELCEVQNSACKPRPGGAFKCESERVEELGGGKYYATVSDCTTLCDCSWDCADTTFGGSGFTNTPFPITR